MGDVLSVEAVQALQDRDLAYDQIEGAIRSVCDSHEELRARLESAEVAMRECDAILARAQAGEIAHPDPEQWPENIRFWKAADQARKRVAAALAAAGERSEG